MIEKKVNQKACGVPHIVLRWACSLLGPLDDCDEHAYYQHFNLKKLEFQIII